MFFRLLKSKAGFTLTEIMIVVTILGIITSVSVPVFHSAYETQARKDCQNQRTMLEAHIREAMSGMLDNGAAQYKRDSETKDIIAPKQLWIDFSKAEHTDKYTADNTTGNSDDAYGGAQCFKLTYENAFTLGDLRGGYRPDSIVEYNRGCEEGYYLKKKKYENKEFYEYLSNQEIPVCPFEDNDNGKDYSYYIFADGTVICSCPKCHE